MRFAAKSFLIFSATISGLYLAVSLLTGQAGVIGTAIAGSLLLWNVVALIPARAH